jgi:hypothetical protein
MDVLDSLWLNHALKNIQSETRAVGFQEKAQVLTSDVFAIAIRDTMRVNDAIKVCARHRCMAQLRENFNSSPFTVAAAGGRVRLLV